MTLLALTLGVVLGATASVSDTAQAQPSMDAPVPSLAPESGTLVIAQDRGQPQRPESRRKLRVIRLEELKIEGRIQKPQAFYLLQRSSLNFDDLNREESFLDKVVEAVEKPPF